MEPYFNVYPAPIHHTLYQCAGLCVSYDFCGSKLYVPVDCNKKYDLVHEHDFGCQNGVVIEVQYSSCGSLYL